MTGLDDLLPLIEELRSEGAMVLLKWDAERATRVCSVVVTRQDTDFVWRKDTDMILETVVEAIADYKAHHAR